MEEAEGVHKGLKVQGAQLSGEENRAKLEQS